MRAIAKTFPFFLPIFFLLYLGSCQTEPLQMRKKRIARPEAITRKHEDKLYVFQEPQWQENVRYPWENSHQLNFPKITKEFFRCRGSALNPVRIAQEGNGLMRYYDCSGTSRHSLPLREGKEFVYPILIDLLNYLQIATGKKVVITSGHRCPEHHDYVDQNREDRCSKHMVGAEVAFYVQGMEAEPLRIIELIMAYYRQEARYQGQPAFTDFLRYDTSKTNVSTPPWYNKEIFIKLYQKHEGRNLDNRHPFAYISLQVRYDWETQEKVSFSWDAAQKNFLRW